MRLMLLLLTLSSICVSCKSDEPLLRDHFNAPLRHREKGLLTSAFSVERNKKEELRAIPGGFRRPLEKTKSRGKSKSKKPNDPFSRTFKNKERDEDELIVKTFRKRHQRPHFIGERWRLFNRDPNRKKKKKQGKKANPTFSRKAKKMDRKQSSRGGEKDLFPNGVLPKMKDLN